MMKPPTAESAVRKTPAIAEPASGPRPVSALWYLLGLFLLLAVVQAYLFMPSGRAVAYSEFKALLATTRWPRSSSPAKRFAGR